MEDPLVQTVRNEATRRRIVIHEDNIIRQAINNIAREMQRRDALNDNDNAPPPLVRHNAPPGDAAMMNNIIAEIERLQQRLEIPNPAAAAALPSPSVKGRSVSPPSRSPSPPPNHPNMGGSRKVKKTKSSKKHTAARRRHSSKARNAHNARKSRKSRNTRRRR